MADQKIVTTKKPADRKPKASAKPSPIIDIDDENSDIPVRLVGIDYIAHRPKAMLAVRLGERIENIDQSNIDDLIASLGDFMRLLFDAADASAIMERLEAPDDRLDIQHLLRLVDAMTEVAGNLPPTSPPASAE